MNPAPSAADLLAQLTLPEKVALLDGSDFWRTQPVERLGLPAVLLSDGPHGLRTQRTGGDHLGLAGSTAATCFPPAAGLASSWDPALVERVGEALGREARAQGVAVVLGPGINLKRTPRCGRNFEYYSEDPFLAGRLGAALVTGIQSQGVGTSVKHFAANNQEHRRMTVSVEVDERTLRELYLPAFEHVVRAARPWTVMCSYNKINGVYASQDPWLLTDLLRDEWGFEGLVVSDWGAVHDRAAGVSAGLDLEMPSSGGVGTRAVLDAVAEGALTPDEVDRAALRVLEMVTRALPALADPPEIDVDAHHAVARQAAIASAVLLRNDEGLLPLTPTGGTIAVIGELARSPRYQGTGSSQVSPTQLDDALSSLRAAAPDREIRFAPGYEIEAEAGDPELIERAVGAAADAAVTVVFLGLPSSYEAEGYDRAHLQLPANQLELLEAVAHVSDHVVVVLSNGSAVTLEWEHHAEAILEGWLLGQAGGSALADLLLGRAEPSGRLAETIPARALDDPAVGNYPGEHDVVRYGEGLLVGYRWYDTRALDVAYPFGHGLGYTAFEYSDAQVVVSDAAAGRVEVSVTVTNTGQRAGTETVQVYVHDPVSAVFRPEQELKGFAQVTLAPGDAERVSIELDSRAFAWWSVPAGRWVVETGDFEVRVGASSRDIRAVLTVELPGDEGPAGLALMSPAGDWLAHADSGPWLRERLAGTELGDKLDDPVHGEMFRAIPLQRLARFPGFPVPEADLAAHLTT